MANQSDQYWVASGGLGFDCLGWPWERPLVWLGIIDPKLFIVVTKTLSWSRIIGNMRANPLYCVRPLGSWLNPDGFVNAVGLSNPGYRWWLKSVASKMDFSWSRVVVSVSPSGAPDIESFQKMVTEIDSLGHLLAGIELNPSCPNVGGFSSAEIIDYTKATKRATTLPLYLKLSAAQKVAEIIPAVEDSVAGISINSVPWKLVFPNQTSPLAHLGGGAVSGRPVREANWELVRQIKAISDVRVIIPDIWDESDLAAARELGYCDYSFGAVHICRPWWPTACVRKMITEY